MVMGHILFSLPWIKKRTVRARDDKILGGYTDQARV